MPRDTINSTYQFLKSNNDRHKPISKKKGLQTSIDICAMELQVKYPVQKS